MGRLGDARRGEGWCDEGSCLCKQGCARYDRAQQVHGEGKGTEWELKGEGGALAGS